MTTTGKLMTAVARMNALVAAGLLSLAIGAERLVNVILVDGMASYTSTRFIVAAVCGAVGGALLVLGAITRRRPRRPPYYGRRSR